MSLHEPSSGGILGRPSAFVLTARLCAFVFTGLAFEFVAISILLGGLSWILLWPAAALLAVSLAYFGVSPKLIFGKSGPHLGRWSKVLLWPYLRVQNALWHLLRSASGEPPFVSLTEGIVIGRRLLAHEYPRGLASVVDLTCEFSEDLPLQQHSVTYLNVPILDGGHPAPEDLDAAVARIAALPRPLYLHCAQGHGRTAMLAACVSIQLGLAKAPADAIELVRTVRPRALLHLRQRAAVERFFHRWQQRLLLTPPPCPLQKV